MLSFHNEEVDEGDVLVTILERGLNPSTYYMLLCTYYKLLLAKEVSVCGFVPASCYAWKKA